MDTVLIDVASERLHSRDPTDGGACRQTVLDDEKTLFPVGVELLGVANLVGLDDTKRLEKTVFRVLVVGLVLRMGEHNLSIVQRREVATCRGGISWSAKTTRRYDTGKDGKRTNINLVALKRRPVKLVVVELDEGPIAG